MRVTDSRNDAIAICSRFAVLMAVGLLCFAPSYAKQKVTELPEVTVSTSKKLMLHVLAYVREYSTLTTYTDTVTLFREKMVDFMLPIGSKVKYPGWKIPRVIKSESYFQFTDANGLDSVSDTSRHIFSWSDWMGLPPDAYLPKSFQKGTAVTDTVFGKFSPTEIWHRKGDDISLEVNVLADTLSRRWVPNLRPFFRDENVEFENFKMKLNYSNVLDKRLQRRDLMKFTYTVDAKGRGHSMFRFNRRDENYYATTEGEMYVLDLEYISEKEAKKWGKGEYDSTETEIIMPSDAPPLSDETLALIDRVQHIDKRFEIIRSAPDRNLLRIERKRNWGQNALRYIKNITGISDFNAERKRNKEYNKLRDAYKKRK